MKTLTRKTISSLLLTAGAAVVLVLQGCASPRELEREKMREMTQSCRAEQIAKYGRPDAQDFSRLRFDGYYRSPTTSGGRVTYERHGNAVYKRTYDAPRWYGKTFYRFYPDLTYVSSPRGSKSPSFEPPSETSLRRLSDHPKADILYVEAKKQLTPKPVFELWLPSDTEFVRCEKTFTGENDYLRGRKQVVVPAVYKFAPW